MSDRSLDKESRLLLDTIYKDSAPESITAENLEAMIRTATRHRLLNLLISKYPPGKGLYSEAAFRQAASTLRVLSNWKIFSERIEDSGLPLILLKGIRSCQDLYLQPSHRFLGDVDILIRMEDLQAWCRLLEDAGFQGPPQVEVDHDYHALFETSQLLVEVHWAFGYSGGAPLQAVWNRSIPLAGENIRGLGDADRFLFQLHHSHKHSMLASLYQYLDIAYLWDRLSDASPIQQLLNEWTEWRGYQLTLELVQELFPNPDRIDLGIDHSPVPPSVLQNALEAAMLGRGLMTGIRRIEGRGRVPNLFAEELSLRQRFRLKPGESVRLHHQIRHLGHRVRTYLKDRKLGLFRWPERRKEIVQGQLELENWLKGAD